MREKFQTLALELREKVIEKYLSDFDFYSSKEEIDIIGSIKDFILRAIRGNSYKLTKSDINDIIDSFEFRIKPIISSHKIRYISTAYEKQELLSYFDEMVEELLNGFLDKKDISRETSTKIKNGLYVNESRIYTLKSLDAKTSFDLSQLVRLCEELNISYMNSAYYSVGLLLRTILNHIPPIFGESTFASLAGKIGTKSNQSNLRHLENSLRSIADDSAHNLISRSVILPNEQTISFKPDLDVLLGLIIKELSK